MIVIKKTIMTLVVISILNKCTDLNLIENFHDRDFLLR